MTRKRFRSSADLSQGVSADHPGQGAEPRPVPVHRVLFIPAIRCFHRRVMVAALLVGAVAVVVFALALNYSCPHGTLEG